MAGPKVSFIQRCHYYVIECLYVCSVSLEPPSDSLDDGDAFPFLIDRGGVAGHMTGAGASIYDIMGGTGSGSGREATKKKQNLNKV